MLEKVKSYAEKWQMLTSEDCVIVGVSGGADSVCLLWVLKKMQEELHFDLVAVHVNHRLRGTDADTDETFVKDLCKEWGVLCECYGEDVELVAKNRKQSTEEAGRDVRRACFEETMKKHGGTKIALAHHLNDNAETFFLNLARGTGLRGLGGMSPVKGNVIRPLLCVSRPEIEECLKAEGIHYCTDATNYEDDYTRNRIRNHVLTYMEQEVNSKVVDHMGETMEQLRAVQEYLDEEIQRHWSICVWEEEGRILISEETFVKVPTAIRSFLIRRALVHLSGREKDIEASHISSVEELFGKQVGRRVSLPYQMVARRVYEGVLLTMGEQESESEEEEIIFDLCEGEKTFSMMGKEIRCRVIEASRAAEENFLTEQTKEKEKKENKAKKITTKYFSCDTIKGKISFRSRRPGDYITIHEKGGTQKLKSYFINEKIPQEERDRVLLVAEGSHILWIVGYRVNPLYKVCGHTKQVLEIKIQ